MKIFSTQIFLVFLNVCGLLEELRPDQLYSFVSKHINDRPVAVMMHVDWCGACKRTLPYFEKAGQTSDFALGHMDVTDASDFVKEMKVSGYPAVRVLAKGSNPKTHFSEWVPVPYYSRDTAGLINYIARVSGSAFVRIDEETGIKHPRFGHLASLLVSGNLDLLPNVDSLKTRFQIVTGAFADGVCGSVPASNICVAVTPADNMVIESLHRVPLIRSVDSSEIQSWIDSHAFPGLWKIQDGRFQMFNEQEVYKVFIVQDPSCEHSSDINETIALEVGKCRESLEGRVAFGTISGPDFEDAMGEFGLTRPTWPSVLMLTDGRLDYDRFYNDLYLSTLCADIESVLAGTKEMKFRGGLGSRIRYSIKRFVQFLGLESEASKAIALFGSVLLITGFTAWALNSCFDEDNDESQKDKKKKTE